MSLIESLLQRHQRPQANEGKPANLFYPLTQLTKDQTLPLLEKAGSNYADNTRNETLKVISSTLNQEYTHPHLAFYLHNNLLYLSVVENGRPLNLCDSKDKRIAKHFIFESLHHSSSSFSEHSIVNLAKQHHQQKDFVFVDTGCQSGICAFSIVGSLNDLTDPYLLTFYVDYNTKFGYGKVNIPGIQAERLVINQRVSQ